MAKVAVIGDCSLVLGDFREVVGNLEPANCIVTDPPYRTISGGEKSALGFGWRESILSKNDGRIFADNDMHPDEISKLLFEAMAPSGDLYCMTNNLNLRQFMNGLEYSGFKFHNFLQWQKDTATANRWYMNEAEHILYYYKGRARPINDCGSKQIFYAPNPRNKVHETEKPVSLMEFLIGNSTDRGDLVLDPFMGSGPAGAACARLGRRFIGVEINPRYYEAALERVENAYRQPRLFDQDEAPAVQAALI